MKLNYAHTVLLCALLSACGGGGSGGTTSSTLTPAPVVSLSLSAAKVWVGDKVTLTWSATNSTSCSGMDSTPPGAKTVTGSELVTATAAGQLKFTISCDGVGGTSKQTANLEVDAVTQSFTQTITKSADADSLGYEKLSKSFSIGEFTFNGGVWGVKSAASYAVTQTGTVDVRSSVASMTNDWDIASSSTPGVVSFTNITLGKHPGLTTSTSTKLPAQIGTIASFVVSGDMKTSCLSTCVFGTILDIFVMDTPNSTPTDIGTEILITTEYGGDQPPGHVAIANIGGADFKVYRNAFPSAWSTIGYSPVNQYSKLNLNIKDFLKDAMDRGYLKSSQYLVSVELGTEVVFGKGRTAISNLKIN